MLELNLSLFGRFLVIGIFVKLISKLTSIHLKPTLTIFSNLASVNPLSLIYLINPGA